MDSPERKEEHLDEAIAKAMGGEAPAVDPLGVGAPASIPIHDSGELPSDCRGAEASKATADATPQELIRHAQYLEWRAGLLAGEAEALRAMAATR
ncbi:MAG TPA: hypothetical protein VF349_02675 [Candidatus Limnocylindrales bacterium]|jgi:hypothetical protein